LAEFARDATEARTIDFWFRLGRRCFGGGLHIVAGFISMGDCATSSAAAATSGVSGTTKFVAIVCLSQWPAAVWFPACGRVDAAVSDGASGRRLRHGGVLGARRRRRAGKADEGPAGNNSGR